MSPLQGIVTIICFLLVGATAITMSVLYQVGKRSNGQPMFQRRERYTPKMKIHPKTAICEPGICQCDDALAYHKGSGKCEVPGCPCQQFIPSDLDANELKEVANVHVTRLAIESVNVRMDLEVKTANLQAAIRDRELRNDMDKRQSIPSGGFGVVEVDEPATMGGRRR